MTALMAGQVAVTLVLTGIVWFVQVVHYPLFAHVEPGSFSTYELEHTRRTTLVVAPLMVVEAVCAMALLVLETSPATALGVLLLAGIWASTFLVQVPCHRVLEEGWNSVAHARLVRSNWVRTALWTVRSAIALGLLV
jgi:hypothetical protein